jgi:hypothetical protein
LLSARRLSRASLPLLWRFRLLLRAPTRRLQAPSLSPLQPTLKLLKAPLLLRRQQLHL